ncbi:MBL fold metallo-hydrolase [candidate division WOR-3 bacterium]|nr:MBL fold metallo-hydrolase [candidate division WOR-3 bacterium]
MENQPRPDSLIFLGSGGARIVIAKQVRASGGIWFNLQDTQFIVDPGPGALVRATSSRHKLNPTRLAAILLSHRHLDHAADVNVLIEAMTLGGTEPRGKLFAPEDALEGDDPVVLRYLRSFLEAVVVLQEGAQYQIGPISFTCPVRHRHRCEVYGFKFKTDVMSISYIADTAYFPELAEFYRADVVIYNVVRYTPSNLDHLHFPEVEELIKAMKPKLSIMTHFGMTMIRARPWKLARELSERTGCTVLAAEDGMLIEFAKYLKGNA